MSDEVNAAVRRHESNAGRRLLESLTGLVALFVSVTSLAQTTPATSVLQNGAVNNRSNAWEHHFYRQSWGYNFDFGSEGQGTYDDGELHAWNVQGNVWMIVGLPNQANVVVQIGNDGVLVVDTGTADMAPKLLALIKKLAAQYAGDHKDIRWVVNTSAEPDRVGGNEVIRNGGQQIRGISLGAADIPGATVVSSQDTLTQLIDSGAAEPLLPSEAHDEKVYSWYFNDEAVTLHRPSHSNLAGSMYVQFRRSDVIAIGNLVTQNAYPKIDSANGGSIDALLTSLYEALDLTVAGYHNGPVEGGTIIIPGQGRLIDRVDLLHYIYVVQTLRNRIMYYKNRGKTLEEVLAMNVTSDFDGRWANSPQSKDTSSKSASGKNARTKRTATTKDAVKPVNPWTPQDFVKAVYETLPPGSNDGPDRFFIPADK